MAKINGNVLTEKGVLKAKVRNAIAEKELDAFKNNELVNYEKTEKGSVMFKEYEDENGNKVYATYTLTISLNDLNREVARKPKYQVPQQFIIED